MKKWRTFWGHQKQAKTRTHMCTPTVPYLGRDIRKKRTAAKTLTTFAAEASLRDHGFET